MTKSRQISSPALGLVFLSVFCALPALADEETTLNLYLNGGQYWFDSDRLEGTPLDGFELHDSTGGGVGFGYSMTDRWAMEVVYDYFSADVKEIDEKVDVSNYHLDLFYHFLGRFCGNECWQPYVAFGVGEVRVDRDHDFDRDLDWHDRQTMVNLGLGIKYQLGPRWQTRADLRAFQGVDRGGLDGFLSVSIGYQWYEFAREVRDYDGDGVFEGMDRCPQTPPGIPVLGDGCPADSDYDGVPDYVDSCPGTPRGIAVDEGGCPQ